MNKLADTTQEELINLIVEGLNETEKTYLGGKNKELQERVDRTDNGKKEGVCRTGRRQ